MKTPSLCNSVPDSWAVRIESVGKQYRIGANRALNQNLREDLAGFLKGLLSGGNGARGTESFWALRDVSLEIQRGETVGVIGRNGAGKSTLLKILSRITAPTTGELFYRGRLASLLEIGTGFHRELTGRENIFLNGSILGMRRREIEQQFDAIVEFSGVEKFLDTPVKRFSSGMYVRLAFAVAAHLRTDILVVDEVLAVGDSEFQKKCLGKMRDVARDGRTVIFVSHNMGAVKRLCRRAILLDHGMVQADGPADETIEKYAGLLSGPSASDLLHAPRTGRFGELIRISRATLTDERGLPKTAFRFGEPIRLELESVPAKSLDNFSYVVGIDNGDGLRVATVFADDAGLAHSAREGETHRAAVTIRPNLAPGSYSVLLGVFKLDVVPRALHFEVTNVDAPPSITRSRTWGAVCLEAHWESLPAGKAMREV